MLSTRTEGNVEMILTEKQQKEFEEVIRQLIKWMNDNTHPHTRVMIDNTTAELYEGICCFGTEEYWKD